MDPGALDLVHDAAARAGLVVMGVTSAAPFAAAREVIEERRARGIAGDMQFTYRNPSRSTDPQAALPGARSIIVAALAYAHPDPVRPSGATAVVARYARRPFYDELRARLDVVREALVAAGHRASVVLDSNQLVDKPAAVRAGVGWYGKNSLVLRRDTGSEVVLGSIVTTAEVAVPVEPVADGCGGCTRCITACPTGAIGDDGTVDARRCLAWLVQSPLPIEPELRVALGDRLYGCDECQAVCPYTKRVAVGGRYGAVAVGPDDAYVDVLDALERSDEELLARYGHWYIPRREVRYLRRNLLYVLANVGDGADPRTRTAIAGWLAADDDVVRDAADWAAERLGVPISARVAGR